MRWYSKYRMEFRKMIQADTTKSVPTRRKKHILLSLQHELLHSGKMAMSTQQPQFPRLRYLVMPQHLSALCMYHKEYSTVKN